MRSFILGTVAAALLVAPACDSDRAATQVDAGGGSDATDAGHESDASDAVEDAADPTDCLEIAHVGSLATGAPLPFRDDPCTGDGWCLISHEPTAQSLRGVCAGAEDDVPIAGSGSTLIRWHEGTWSYAEIGDIEPNAVWGSGPDDVWITCEQGKVLHWHGESWNTVEDADANVLWGTGPDDVWAAFKFVLRNWNGETWVIEDTPANQITDLDGVPGGRVWALGGQGEIVVKDP